MVTFFPYEILKAAAVDCTLEAISRVATSKGLDLTPDKLSAISPRIIKALGVPPEFELGQVALPCFAFAKELGMKPPDVATALAEAISDTVLGKPESLFAQVAPAGGFLNFSANFDRFATLFLGPLLEGQFFGAPLHTSDQAETIVVEYSQPNTHKALHVGHLRGLVLGEAVCNLLEGVGHKVIRTTYPGDHGAHIAKTLWFLKTVYNGPIPTTHRGDWLGDLYANAHAHVEEASKDEAQAARIKAEIGEVLSDLQYEKGPYYDLWKETREWSLEEMRGVYNWMGVTFDEWYTESECDAPSRELVLERYKEGLFVKDQGAIGIDLSPYKLGFALLLKSDGNGLYLTKDLELIKRKFADPAVARSIVVVDARQKLHFRQVFKIAELMGYPQAARSVHLDYETVNTADGKKAFSSRTLNGLKLAELRESMEGKVETDYLERYRGDWTDEEIKKTSGIVAKGALKYGMLKVDNNTQVNFDLAEWLRLDGDTGPYLQYVHARCRAILAKQVEASAAPLASYRIEHPAERELLIHLGRYFDALRQSAETLRPTFVATHLYELARGFNRFYEQCSIRDSEGVVKASRLALVRATALVMQKGLATLGIEAPHRM